jgi:hypothetical protein
MTSMIKERHDPAPGAMPSFRDAMTRRFVQEFGRTARQARLQDLGPARVPSG